MAPLKNKNKISIRFTKKFLATFFFFFFYLVVYFCFVIVWSDIEV